MNETFDGEEKELGIIIQGGLYNGLMLALKTLGLADAFGKARIPILALNVVYPLVPEEITAFCSDKKARRVGIRGSIHIEELIRIAKRMTKISDRHRAR